MVVLAAGGIGTSTDRRAPTRSFTTTPGKWLAELGLGNSQLQQCFPGSFRFRVHQRYDYNEHFPGDIHCAYGFLIPVPTQTLCFGSMGDQPAGSN